MTANTLIVDGVKNYNFTQSGKLFELQWFDVDTKEIIVYIYIIRYYCFVYDIVDLENTLQNRDSKTN